MSKKLVSMCLERNVDTLVIGDVRNIRQNIDYGSKANQKLHQWIHGTFRRMIEYKAKLVGMGVKLQNEANTSKRCPSCGTHNNPDGRDYSCSSCGFEYHRDGVGAINIRSKYLGNDSQVVGDMASPTGVRFKPNMSCSSSSVCKTQDYLEPTR
jgi:putative transposase